MSQKSEKKRGWKRLLSFMLALAMVFTLLPVGAWTAYADESDSTLEYDYTYSEIREKGDGKAYYCSYKGIKIYMDIMPQKNNSDVNSFRVESLEQAISNRYITDITDYDTEAEYYKDIDIQQGQIITLGQSYTNNDNDESKVIKSGYYWIFHKDSGNGDEFYGRYASSKKDEYKNLCISKLEYADKGAHTHKWEYTLDDDRIVAKCTDKRGYCQYNGSNLYCKIEAENRIYSGGVYDGLNVTNYITRITGDQQTVKYYLSDGSTLTTPENSNAALEGAEPKKAGEYIVKLTISNITIAANFKIMEIDGSGTEGDPYLIHDTTELRDVLSLSSNGTYYKLSDDFTNAEEITDCLPSFEGNFDGNEKTVKLNINDKSSGNIGLFSDNRGTIENLTVEGSATNKNYSGGGICYYNAGTISNCTNKANISGYSNIGGICGQNYGTISNCINEANISGRSTVVGGICGYNSKTITGCKNKGDILSGEGYAGGITGKNGDTGYDATVENCKNEGTVTCTPYEKYTGYNDCQIAYQKSGDVYKVIGKVGNEWHQIHYGDHPFGVVTNNEGGLSVNIEPAFVASGKILKFTVSITNNASESISDAKVAIYGDTELSGCDRSTNKTNASQSAMTMSFNGISFLAFSNDEGFRIVNTKYGSHEKIDAPQYNDKCDSAYSAQWTITSMTANETVTRTFYMGCVEGEEITDEQLKEIESEATHIHSVKYSVNGNKVEAYCTDTKCKAGTSENNKCSLTLTASDEEYSPDGYTGVELENNITRILDVPASVTYVGREGTTYVESETAPKDAGKYTVKVTIGKATVTANFEIERANLEPTVSLANWVYGQSASSPDVEGNVMNGSVTYYYKVRGAKDSTYVAIDSELDFSNIPVGEYTLKACIGETTNYNAATAYCDFAVTKNLITVNVSMEGWTYGDTAKTPSIADDSNPGNGKVTYTYYTDEACTKKTTSANGAASNGAVPKNAGTYYVKADVAETDNYAAGSGKTEFTIAKKNVTATVSAKNKTYDGTLNADVEAAVAGSDLISGDTIVITGITGTFADKNAGNNKQITVDSSNPTITGAGAENYNVTIDRSETITATIDKRVVELQWDNNPTYTGEEQSMEATVSNAVAGDSFHLEYTGNTGTNVGNVYTAKVTALGNDNYTLEGSKTAEQKWSIEYLTTEATVVFEQTPDGNNGWYKEAVTVKAPEGYLISEDGKTWTEFLSYNEDGRYTKGYYLKDANGHITDKKVVEFKIDTTVPTGTVTIREKKFTTFLKQITFGCFFKNNAEIIIEGADATSDIAKIEYQKVSNGETFDKDGKWTEGNKLSIAANDKAVIYVRLTDNAGNQSIINTDGIVVYTDATAKAEETFTKSSTKDVTTGITVNGNTIASVMVKNAEDESAEATLVDASNYEIKDDKLVLKASYLQTLVAGKYTLTVNYNPCGETYTSTSSGDKPEASKITFTINKATGSITDISDISKVYDGNAVTSPTFTTTNDRGTDDANVTVEYKKQGADDSTYTSEAPQDYGKYVVCITIKADEDYETVVTTKEFSIHKKEMKSSADGYTGTYDGQAYGITVNVTDPADNAASNVKVVYGTKDADGKITYSENPVTYKDAGEYTVYYKVTADNYEDVTGSAVVKIAPKTVSLVWSDTEFTYDGKAHKPTAKVNASDIIGHDQIDITVRGEQTNAGDSYTAEAVRVSDGNYVLGDVKTTTYKILPKALVEDMITLDQEQFGYDSKDHGPLVCVKDGETELVADTDYTVDGDVSKNEPGEYTVTVIGRGNYAGTIEKKWKIYQIPTSSGGTKEDYKVPIRNEDTVQVDVTITDGKAEVSDITKDTLNSAINNPNKESKVDTITIDLSGAKQTVTSVSLSKTTVKALSDAVSNQKNGIDSTTIALSNATVTLDAKTLQTLEKQAKGSQIELVVEDTKQESLNADQKKALEEHQVAATFEAYFVSGGERVHDFNGGSAVVAVKFVPENGNDVHFYHMVYVAEDGKLTYYKTRYKNGKLEFTTTHFSDYAIIYDDSEKNDTDADNSGKDETIKVDSSYAALRLRVTKSTKTSNVLKWTKYMGADGYVVYGNKCNTRSQKYKLVKLATVKGGKTTYTSRKLAKGTYYKYYVKAYKFVDGKKVWIATSKVVHATTSGSKYGNAKRVSVNKTSFTLSVGKSATIKAKQIEEKNPIKHHTDIKYESSDKSVASVSKHGVIKAKKAGMAYIYVYAQNGVYKKVKVTVK